MQPRFDKNRSSVEGVELVDYLIHSFDTFELNVVLTDSQFSNISVGILAMMEDLVKRLLHLVYSIL